MIALRRFLTVASALAFVGSAAARDLEEVPTPVLTALEERVQEQLTEARAELDGLLEQPGVDDARLASAFGGVGQLYYLYDLIEAARVSFENAASLDPDDFRWSYYLGAIAQSEGRFDVATERFERVLELQPEDLASQIRLADILLDLGEVDAAEAIYRRNLDGAAVAAAHYGLGRVAAYRRDPETAIAHFTEALAEQPEANGIHHRMGMAYRQLGDLDLAREHLAQNRGQQVRFPDPLIEGLGRLLQASHVFFKAGVDALRKGDVAAAIPQLERARAENPEDPLIHYNLGFAYLQLGAEERAEESYRQSIAVDPDFRNGHFNLATLLAERGLVAEAERHFRRAHEIDPQDADAHREWATALATLGRRDEAIAELEKLIAERGTDIEARLNLALLYSRAGDREAALRQFEKASRDGSAEADRRRAALLERSGRTDEALEAYAAWARKEPESAEALEQWAFALGRLGDYAAAAERFAEAVALEKNRQRSHLGVAMSRLLGGDDAAAVAALESALAVLPRDPQLRHLLARVLVASADEAVRDGERGLELAMELVNVSRRPEHAETVAMALAELGRFEEAVDWQQRVVERLDVAGEDRTAGEARERLDLYRERRPCREPWLPE